MQLSDMYWTDQIQQKMIDALKAKLTAAGIGANVLEFSKLSDDANKPQIAVQVAPDKTDGGGPGLPFKTVPCSLFVLVTNAADKDRDNFKKLYKVIADYRDALNKDVSSLNNEDVPEYNVDGLVMTEGTPQPPVNDRYSGKTINFNLKCTYVASTE